MSKYEKTEAISREEEATYHRREYEHSPGRPPVTTTYETYTVPATVKSSRKGALVARRDPTSDDDDDDNFEEWTTSKRKVNHKTRQVETRVSRQLLVEDGKVIADSGPQVTTRIKEDNKVEECEKEKAPKNRSRFEALESAPESGADGCSGRVLGEKKEIQRVSREVREENLQYHDERFKELTGHDVHRKAIRAPHELMTINDGKSHDSAAPRGKMVHYSNKGKKYQDTDEILEVAKLAIDGSITKEVKRTKHHEEFSEDEQPDEKGEAEALRHEPIVTRSSRRHVDYVNDFDDTATPSCSSDDDDDHDDHAKHSSQKSHHNHQHQHHHHLQTSGSNRSRHNQHHRRSHHHHQKDDEAFPRYQIDPLLNSLRDEDFRPATGATSAGRQVEHPLERKDHNASSSDQDHQHRPARVRTGSPVAAVEIPEEYRVNRHKLLSSKSGGARERSFSPKHQHQHQHQQRGSSHHRSSNRLHREDAGVQARLTDEEVERRSVQSSSSGVTNSHEKQTRHLQRQSTANSSRNYYYGDRKHQRRQRKDSVGSSSSSSSSSIGHTNPKERLRQQGTRSRDSGFKSPQSGAASPQQIYSVSGKSRRRGDGAMSPTLSQASAGQRSVKTTTTTMSAGLADRPLSRNAPSSEPKRPARSTKDKQQRQHENGKVSKPPSPFQKLASYFAPAPNKTK